jgi:hypothetical protein
MLVFYFSLYVREGSAVNSSFLFRLRARLPSGEFVSPSKVDLDHFRSFNKEVEDFVLGSSPDRTARKEIVISVEEGSLSLKYILPVLIASTLSSDIQVLRQSTSLDGIDSTRAKIADAWQLRALQEADYSVQIGEADPGRSMITIDRTSTYKLEEDSDLWVLEEQYVVGRVMDLGGVSKANAHLKIDGAGPPLVLASTPEYLGSCERNYLYQDVLAHISYKRNLRNGRQKELRLVDFVGLAPSYDSEELAAFVEKGTKVWSGVDANTWVREWRGDEE